MIKTARIVSAIIGLFLLLLSVISDLMPGFPIESNVLSFAAIILCCIAAAILVYEKRVQKD